MCRFLWAQPATDGCLQPRGTPDAGGRWELEGAPSGGSTRCPGLARRGHRAALTTLPGSCPAEPGLVRQTLRPRGPPGAGSARGRGGGRRDGLPGLATGRVPPRPPQAPPPAGAPPPSPSPTAGLPLEAPPGRLPRLCNPRCAIFPSKLRLFPGSHRNSRRSACPAQGGPLLCPSLGTPETPLLRPRPPAARPTDSILGYPHPPPHPHLHPPGRVRSHLLGALGRRVVQEPRRGETEARRAQEQEEE